MRLHSDVITWPMLHTALVNTQNSGRMAPHVFFTKADEMGSRPRERAFEVKLGTTVKIKRDGRHHQNTGTHGAHSEWNRGEDIYGATYDEWGWFIAELYEMDPNLIFGDRYKTREDFDRITQHRYELDNNLSLVPRS